MSGSRNVTTLSLEKHLEQSLRRLESEFLQFKNRQPVGGDVLTVDAQPGSASPLQAVLPLTPGQGLTAVATLSPGNSTLTLVNYALTVYVDTPLLNTSLQFPSGNALTTNQRNFDFKHWLDWADSNDTTNTRVLKVRITNNDTASHTYYIYIVFYLPHLSATTT